MHHKDPGAGEGDKDHRNSWDKKAEKQLSQARRCEQMAYRIQFQDKVETQYKAEKYVELNQQAIKRICNNINQDEQEEKNLCERLAQYGDDASNPNLVPALARHARKYHQKHDRCKKGKPKKSTRR